MCGFCEEVPRPGCFLVVEHVAAVLGVDERGQQVIGRLARFQRDHVGRYGGELGVRGVDGRRERRIGDGLQPADHRAARLATGRYSGRDYFTLD